MAQKQFARFLVFTIGIETALFLTGFHASADQLFTGVCPPFFLKDDTGTVINPVTGKNTGKPYSPKQTCGTKGCHNYDKITQGYHFQQGKDENPNPKMTSLYQWVLSPGQYGGRW